jgi:hypothetical protein
MSGHNDKRSRKDRKPRPGDTVGIKDSVQGEGDYRAAKRYRENVEQFVATADVDALAQQAAPSSAKEARDLALAEDRGRDRSKGDDAADPGIMYPGRKPDANR